MKFKYGLPFLITPMKLVNGLMFCLSRKLIMTLLGEFNIHFLSGLIMDFSPYYVFKKSISTPLSTHCFIPLDISVHSI